MKIPVSARKQMTRVMRAYVAATFSTQTEAAKAFGISRPFMSDVLSGSKSPNTQMMKRAGFTLAVVAAEGETKL